MNEFDIYTFGAGFYLEKIFNAIRLIIDGKENFIALMKIACIGAIVMLAARAGINNDFKSAVKWFFGVTIVVGLFLTTRATVHIHDRLPDSYGFIPAPRTVENVPWGLAFLGSITSQVGHAIGEKFDMAFSAVFVNPDYQKTGLLFGSKIIEDTGRLRISDANLQKFMRDFYKRCIVPDLYMGHNRKNGYTIRDLVNEPNILEFLKDHASRARMIYFSGEMKILNKKGGIFGDKSTTSSRTINDYITCNQGAHYISDILDYEMEQRIPKLASGFLKYFFPDQKTADKDEIFKSILQSSYGIFIRQSAKDAKDILLQNVMINAIGDSANSFSKVYGKVTTEEMTKSMRYSMGQMAQKYVPVFLATLECLFYGVFPLILVLMVTPMGLDILRAYGYGFVYLQLWQPMYAILFCIASAWGKYYAGGIEAITFASHLKVSLINEEISSVAGFMLIMVPTLSVFITKGMVASIGNLSSTIYQGPQSAAISNATRAVEGNYQIGTTSLDTHSFNNTSGNKYDDNYSWVSGMSISQLPSGAMVRTSPDGTKSLDMGPAISNLAGLGKVEMSKAIGDRFDKSINEQMSIAQRSTSSIVESASAAHSKMLGFDSNWSHDSRSYQDWRSNLNSEQRESLDEARSYIAKFAENHGISQRDALKLSIAANLPGATGLSGVASTLGADKLAKALGFISIGGDASTGATKEESFSKMLEAARNKSFAESLAKIEGYAKSDTQQEGDEVRKAMMQSARADFIESNAAQMEISKAFENVRSLQESKGAYEQNAGSISQDLSNHFADNLIKKYGAENVDSMLRNKPEETYQLLNETLDKHMLTSHSEVSKQYASSKAGIDVSGHDVVADSYRQNKEAVKFAEESNKNQVKSEAPDFTQKVEGVIKAGNDKKTIVEASLTNTQLGLENENHKLTKERVNLIKKAEGETNKSAIEKLKDSWFSSKSEEDK